LGASKALLRTDFDPDFLMRVFTVIPVLLILMAGAGALWIYFFALSLLPAGESLIDVSGLTADVRVVRDANGIPYIIGEREEDVALVLGYVMAQDRLWQMDYLRRAGQGRLAEILGSDYLDGDHLMRALRASIRPQEYPGNFSESEKRWLDNFIQGVNKYISAHAKKPPVEFSLLEYRPSLFSADDIMSICLALAWESSPAVRVDPILTRVLGRLGRERAMELWPTDPAASAGFVSSDLSGWEPRGLLFPKLGNSRALERVYGFRGGCLWAFGPERSRSERPVACTSVYQRLSAPGFWYRAHLTAGDFHLSGAFIPGVPAAIVGSNMHITWGCISALADDADLFIEKVNIESPQRYWKIDRWRKIEDLNEVIRTTGGSSTTRTIRLTDTGPLVSDVDKDKALSFRWTAWDGLGLMPAWLKLNRAGNGDELRTALKHLVAPCMYVVWADDGRNWGIQFAGRVPIRVDCSDGIVPQPAWTGVHDWLGFIPFDELPRVTNPALGLAVAADDRPGGSTYPYFVSCYWNDEARDLRIIQLLERTQALHREVIEKLQNDNLSPLARDLTPKLLKVLDRHDRKGGIEQDAIKLLSSWDWQMNKESPAAAVFALFYQSLVDEVFRAPLGDPLYQSFASYPPLASKVIRRVFLHDQTKWLAGSDPEQVLAKSFRKAMVRGRNRMGGDVSDWRWGRIHTATFVHPLTVRSRFLESLFQVGPISVSGSVDTINCAGWTQPQTFHVIEGASLRQISDMTDPPQVFSAGPMGVSAHFFSKHYKNQTRAWFDGRSFQDPVQFPDARKLDSSAVLFKHRVGQISMEK